MKRWVRSLLIVMLSVVALPPASVSAQPKASHPSGAYPSKTVRFIITFPPGGATDILARVLAQKLRDTMGQQFLIDNRIGAAGNMGAELAARAAPDGYTILMSTVGNAINASLSSTQTYDILRDFEAVSELASTSFMLVVHAGVAAANVKELVALAKSKPGALNYGSSGTGGPSHLSMELFKNATQLNIVHVPYKGSGPASADVAAGQIHMMFTGL